LQGVCAYRTTQYCKKNEHTGQYHSRLVQNEIGDGSLYQAIVADNTSNMKKMFVLLAAIYLFLFFVGCCVHVLDLLVEDVAKIVEIAEVVNDYHFMVGFLKRHSLLYEAFMESQKDKFGAGQFKTLRQFPLTRFAYAYLMLQLVIRNWSLVRDVSALPEYNIVFMKALKGKNKAKVTAEFTRFKDLCGTNRTRELGDAVCSILMPLTMILHFMEGDKVPPSFLIPLYSLYYMFVCHLPSAISDALEDETITDIKAVVKARWLGGNGIVGLRADLHCLVFVLDPYARAVVKALLGDKELANIDKTFSESNVLGAVKNYVGGVIGQHYAQLVSEYNRYVARSGQYKDKLAGVEALVKLRLTDVLLAGIDEERKKSPVLTVLYALQRLHLVGSAVDFYKGLTLETTDTGPFVEMAVNTLSIVIHACGVERVNKNHNMVHCKARAGMGETNVVKSLFCYTNLRLAHRGMTSDLTFRSWCASTLSEGELEDISETLNWEFAEDADILPATTGAAADNDSDDATSEDESEEEEDAVDLEFEVPEGFVALDKPAVLFSGKTELRGLYVHMMWATNTGTLVGWETGKVKKYAPKRLRHNYDVMWDEGIRGSMLLLDDYYVEAADVELKGGEWVFMRLDD
jgi:hypothetical protein